MKYSLFFSSLVVFGVFSNVQCGFFKRIFNFFVEPPNEEPEEASLVLGIEEESKYCVVANVPILTTKDNPNFQTYLFLCPAEDDNERKINEVRSITKNTLFIRETYGNLELEKNAKKNKVDEHKPKSNNKKLDDGDFEYLEYDCEEPVTPSVKNIGFVEEQQIDIFFVGFEVYMGEKYKDIKVLNFAKTAGLNPPDFQWFNILTIRFDLRNGNVLSVNAEVFNDVTTYLSPRYQFGQEALDPKINRFGNQAFYKNFDIESQYSLDMQRRIIFPRVFRDPTIRNIYFNIPQNRYLVENHLAPLNGFVAPVLELAAHSYGNIAPMWKIIKENSWKNFENYINYLVEGVLGTYIVTGTYGTLTLANTEIYLGTNETIRVPLVFWKLVQYIRKLNQFYNMLIVTTNNPYEDVPVDLCPMSQCKEYGWEYIEQDFYPLGRTRCCIVTEKNMTLLHLEDFIKPDRILNLRKVPHLDDEKLTLNLTKFIEDRKKQSKNERKLKADDAQYRNPPGYLLENERKAIIDDKKKKEASSGFGVTEFATWLIKDHALPYVNSLFVKKKEGVEEKSPFLHELKHEIDEKKTLSNKEDGNVDGKQVSRNREVPTDVKNSTSNDEMKADSKEKDPQGGQNQTDNDEVKPSVESGPRDNVEKKTS